MGNSAVSRERRTLTDPQRMLWRDDVEGICQSPDLCFEHGGRVRCGPCGIKQATQAGVESDLTVANLPEVCRLRRRIAELEAALRPFAEAGAYLKSETIGYEPDDKIWLTVKDQCGKSHGLIEVEYGAFQGAALTLSGADGEGPRG